MTRFQSILIITGLSGAGFGALACNRTPDEAYKEAVETQKEAVQDIRENNQEAQQAVTEAQREAAKTGGEAARDTNEAVNEANAKAANAIQEARHDNAQVQAEANKDIREANADVIGGKADLRVWGQKKLDDLNNLIDGARVKAQKAIPTAQAKLEVGLKQVEIKRDELTHELASIETQSAEKAAAFKARLDSEVDQLKTRVEKIERAL